jgi:succinate dehydrogenase/fumarate reductase flavoprotein subunit
MNWTNDDVKMVEKFNELKTKGFYCDGAQLTEVYNRVLDKRVNPTNCGSCIRQRINELEDALNRYKKSQEELKEVEVDNAKEEENKELTAKESMKERMARVRAAKIKK